MKKLLAILLIGLMLLTSFSVVAKTEGGYTHLPVGDAANSKLFLPFGEFSTSYTKFVDYMGYGMTDGKSILTDDTSYNAQALFYTRDKSKQKATVLYLGEDNIWTVDGFDFVLEPEKPIIKISKNYPVELTDLNLYAKVIGIENATCDIPDGYYRNLELLIAQPSTEPGNLKVTVEYEDKTTETTTLSVLNKADLPNTQEQGYIITRGAKGEDIQAARRFMRYTVPFNENKIAVKVTYSTAGTWRHFYIISQMAENSPIKLHKNEVQKHINVVAGADLSNIQLSEAISYVKAEKILKVLESQYNFADNEFENYQRYLSVTSNFEERLKSTSAFDIFVSVNESSNGDGSIQNPFTSIENARDLIEEAFLYDINKAPFNVNLRGGEYKVEKSIELNNNHSGTKTAPVTYKAYNGEEVVITTADKINVSQLNKVTDKAVLNKLDKNSIKYIKQVDLDSLKIKNPGLFLPNSEMMVDEDAILVSEDRQLPVAQYPNGDMNMTMALSVIESGDVRQSTLVNQGGGTIEISPQQAEKWEYLNSMESYISGCFFEPWMFERLLIDEVSTDNNRMKFYSGSYGGIKASSWGGLRYKIMHVLCELDTPGEWYIDRESNILYYYPHDNDKEIYISTELFDAFSLNNVSYVNFDGLTFKNIRGNAIYAQKGLNDATIKNCTFKNIAKNAIQVVEQKDGKAVGYNVDSSYNLKIESNSFISVGNYAMFNNGSGHSGTLTYSGNTFRNNYIYDCANLSKKYMVNIVNAVADRFENNLLHKSEMGGFTFTGNDMFVGYNEVYNMGQNSADVAGIYTGRSYVRTNNEIAYNYVYNSKPLFPQLINHHRGIYLDDGTSGQYVHHNIANNVTYMTSASGKKNRILNNIILGESKTPISLGVSDYLTDAQMLNPLERARNLDNYGEIWLKKYPWLSDIDKWTDFNNEISGNVTQLPIYYSEEWAECNNVEEDIKNNIALGMGNYEPFVNPENHDFRVKKDSSILQTNADLPNENNFSMDSIGLQGDIITKVKNQLTKENSPFDIIMPKRNSTVSKTDRVFFMWQTAEHADEYDFKLYKSSDLSNPVYETTTGTSFVELNDFQFENIEYSWTVTAKVDSLKIRAEWESEVKYNSFKITPVTVNEDIYEYVDLRPYNNAVCFVTAGQSADRIENGRYVFGHDFALNLEKFKSQLDERNMVKAGDVYYKLNQLDDKYKGILNYHEEIEIDIPDGKYEEIYLLGSLRCSNLAKKNIKVKYLDGTEESLNLGQQVHYDSVSNPDVSGAILPQVYAGAVWVKKAEIRGDWFGAGAYSHTVKPSENKTITSIILPKSDVVTEAFDTYAITLKYADAEDRETIELKNLTDEKISLDIIEEKASGYKITKLNIEGNEKISTSVSDESLKVFFWDIRTLYPYSNTIKMSNNLK